MDTEEFRKHGHELIDWIADYFGNIRDYPVKSKAGPGDVFGQLPDSPPDNPESFDNIIDDFRDIILPGITHWQHPSFMAYFPANSSPPSVLAEMLTAAIGAQCMIWQTSPAAAELEERVMLWLRDMIGLPQEFSGVIQDTASTATLCSILTAREKKMSFTSNRKGLTDSSRFRIYCSSETHSSVDKAVRIAGLGSDNIQRISVRDDFSMDHDHLRKTIEPDINNGYEPLCIIATLGTTSSTAIDPLESIGKIAKEYGIWLHVDAALAGTALLLAEYRWMTKGIELADTFVFNPHKWMFTNFDCSAYFVKDESALIRTFEILPEYLKTSEATPVKNYRDWGIQLGRRFRALKLWFVIRSYGVNGLRTKVRHHLRLAHDLLKQIKEHPKFEILAPVPLNLICFRYKPNGITDEAELEKINSTILTRINDTGELFLTHTKLNGKYAIRIITGQTNVEQQDVDNAWELVKRIAGEVISS